MDSVRGSPLMKKALDCTNEITKLIKFSPCRDVLFEKIKCELAPQSPRIYESSLSNALDSACRCLV